VTIVTGDRDAFQLVDEAGLVSVMATARGITETKLYDRAAVIERYGIAPELIPDFYGLKGDTSDNIPGVPGIGEKTAAELLQKFGSLESVLERVDEVSGEKRRANLVAHRDDAIVSKQLATMRRDLPLELDLAAIQAGEPDMGALREAFRRYELRDPLRRLEEAIGGVGAGAVAAEPAPLKTRQVTIAQLAALGEGELAIAVRAPEVPEGALFGEAANWTFGVATGGEVLSGEVAEPAELVDCCWRRTDRRSRRQVARRGAAAARARHDARRLPARSGAARLPARRALRGPRPRRGAERCAGGRAARACARRAAAARARRAWPRSAAPRRRAAARRRAARDGGRGAARSMSHVSGRWERA
jgi:hypothetical protein